MDGYRRYFKEQYYGLSPITENKMLPVKNPFLTSSYSCVISFLSKKKREYRFFLPNKQ